MKYIKWENKIIAEINNDYTVDFESAEAASYINPDHQDTHWTSEEFAKFLDDRVISRQRRDIEKILFRCGLSSYNIFKIAEKTKAVNAKDLLWISDNEADTFEDAVTDVFESIFMKNIDMVGDSVNSPEGCNIKRYGVYNGKYGIYKERLHPLSTDVESEVAVYGLAKRLNIPCCRAVQTDENTVFSEFEYDFAKEQIIHFRRLFEDGERKSENELENLLIKRPQYKSDFYKMIFLDFLTLQDDRHLSNFAIKVNTTTKMESFYPLYDNGRSLFYQDNENTIQQAYKNPRMYCTTFGAVGSYYDHIEDIFASEPCAISLIDLTVAEDEVYKIMKNAGFNGYKLEGIVNWVSSGIGCLKELSINQNNTEDIKYADNDGLKMI